MCISCSAPTDESDLSLTVSCKSVFASFWKLQICKSCVYNSPEKWTIYFENLSFFEEIVNSLHNLIIY